MKPDEQRMFDRYRDDEEPDEFVPLHCKSCGSTDVRWRLQGDKWTMFSMQPGILHVCDTSEDFE